MDTLADSPIEMAVANSVVMTSLVQESLHSFDYICILARLNHSLIVFPAL